MLALAGLVVVVAGCGGGSSQRGAQAGPEVVAGGVIFRYYDRDAERVHVVGDFDNWVLYADPLIDRNGDGEWTVLLNLAPGRYEYKFVIDGVKWIPDPKNKTTVDDGFGNRNSVIVVPGPTS